MGSWKFARDIRKLPTPYFPLPAILIFSIVSKLESDIRIHPKIIQHHNYIHMSKKNKKGQKPKKIAPKVMPSRTEINITEIDKHERYPDVFRIWTPKNIQLEKQSKKQFTFLDENGIRLQVTILTDRIVRFRYNIHKQWATDFSYAIKKDFKRSRVNVELEEHKHTFAIRTKSLHVLIHKSDMAVKIVDTEGKVLAEDATGFTAKTSIHKGVQEVALYRKAQKNESYLGLGDKSTRLNLRGKQFQNWVTDAFAYSENTDPLYRTVPFYYALNKGNAYGIFFDNTFRSFFDFDSNGDNTVKMSANGGEMNYYFIYGPDLTEIAQQYAQLTGTPEIPPMWALGFHQCRWSYYPEKRVRELANDFRKKQIPCDAIYLDIDYMDGYRCFTWNKKYFPNPKGLISDLNENGFQTVVMIDPGIKTDEEFTVYQQGIKKDHFCKRPDGDMMTGPVWPSDCAFPDFTKKETREWWGNLYKELYKKQGVSGFWNDMNEPAVFLVDTKTFPEDVHHHYEGLGASHKKVHNIYGMQMTRASYNGFKKLQPKKRPFLLTRATYSGGQRYASVWTGDNCSDWNHLRIANRQCQRLSISGFSFVGTDIGGFAGLPTGELMVRWLQLAIFHPLYRVHSIGNNIDGATEVDGQEVIKKEKEKRIDQEPWAYGEPYTSHARAAIQLRYQLIAYMYTAFRKYTLDGTPMMRSLSFYDQSDKKTLKTQRDFIFGDDIMVSPVVREGRKSQKVYMPKGNWYSVANGKHYKGKNRYKLSVSLKDVPMFAKAGSVIPFYPVQQYMGEKDFEEITLRSYYNDGTYQSQLYEDAGDGYQYTKGDFCLKTFKTEGDKKSFRIKQTQKGEFDKGYDTILLLTFGLPFTPKVCLVDGESVKPLNLGKKQINGWGLRLPADFKTVEFFKKKKS